MTSLKELDAASSRTLRPLFAAPIVHFLYLFVGVVSCDFSYCVFAGTVGGRGLVLVALPEKRVFEGWPGRRDGSRELGRDGRWELGRDFRWGSGREGPWEAGRDGDDPGVGRDGGRRRLPDGGRLREPREALN